MNQYTPNERKALAQVFSALHCYMAANPPWITHRNSRYICDNIRNATTDPQGEPLNELCALGRALAKDVIHERIREFCVARWLHKQGHISLYQLTVFLDGETKKELTPIQEYRLAWLKSLEAEFTDG